MTKTIACAAAAVLMTAVGAASAATLVGPINAATGIDDLDIGGSLYDITFVDANGGTFNSAFGAGFFESLGIGVDNFDDASTVLAAVDAFMDDLGATSNTNNDFLAMAYDIAGAIVEYATAPNASGTQIFGPFLVDRTGPTFGGNISWVTVSPSFVDPAPVPVPGAFALMLPALGAAAWRRVRTKRAAA